MSTIEQHQQLESSLQLAGLYQPSSEVHGLIVGSIANHMLTAKAPNLMKLIMGQPEEQNSQSVLLDFLNEMYRNTSEILLENNEDYQLLLVDEEAKLPIRTESLADWCRGYLLGLFQNDSVTIDQLPEDSPEIARDILAISEAGSNHDGESDENSHQSEEEIAEEEWALAELEEYVKVGTQLIFEFIIRSRSEQQPQPPLQ